MISDHATISVVNEHELICAVRQLAEELGVTPTRYQFEANVKNGRHALEKTFGNYQSLLNQAGLVPVRESKKINDSIFEKDIELHLSEHQRVSLTEKATKLSENVTIDKSYHSIAVISDIHWPFHDQKVIERFYEYVGDEKPEYVIINGDAMDMYSHSKFPKSHNIFTPRDEMATAQRLNAQFWVEIEKRCPTSKKIQTLGNHCIRPLKRILNTYPEAEDWITEKLNEIFTFPGVETIFDHRQEIKIGNILVFHGYKTKLGSHRDFVLANTINGHSHVGGVLFRQIQGQVLWELNSGLAGDPEAKGLTYTPQKITNWTPGFGAVTKYGPQFIHY